jgi:hypothetical protein
MELRDPVAAHTASSNVEAQLVCELLVQAGVAATVVEDVSTAGLWVGGTVSEIHRPQVWIERADSEADRKLLSDYEERQRQRRDRQQSSDFGEKVTAVCEECGRAAEFAAAQRGSIQDCPHCGAYMDVGEIDMEGWDDATDDGLAE